MNFYHLASFLILLPLLSQKAFGQDENTSHKESLLAWYDQQVGADQIGLIEGTYFPIYYTKHESHQFFKDKNWTTGSVVINGQSYRDVTLMYELFEDVLLMRHPTNYQYHGQAIKLPSEKIDQFRIHGSLFRNIRNSEIGLKDGFHQVLYEGATLEVLARRKKIQHIDSEIEYVSEDQWLIVLDSSVINLKNKQSYYKQWPDWKVDIRKYAREHQLKVNRKHEDDFVKLAIYIDERSRLVQ